MHSLDKKQCKSNLVQHCFPKRIRKVLIKFEYSMWGKNKVRILRINSAAIEPGGFARKVFEPQHVISNNVAF